MSKKPTAEAEPSNALLMRAITGLNAKFDKLPTVQHLEKKINDNNQALRTELMGEFEEKINAQAERVEQAISEIKTQIDKRPATCLLYTSPSPRDRQKSRMPSSA